MSRTEKDNSILRDFFDDSSITQREIAKRHDISLGQANSILKKLIEQGFLKIEKSEKKIKYLITPIGEKAIEENGLSDLDRTAECWNKCLDIVEKIVVDAARLGNIRIALVEHTGFERMFEYVCLKTGRELVNRKEEDAFLVDKAYILKQMKQMEKK